MDTGLSGRGKLRRGSSHHYPINVDDTGSGLDHQTTATRSNALSDTAEAQGVSVCPYYYDDDFELMMYRGPGYEEFPATLGSNPDFQKYCDEWDKRADYRQRMNGSAPGLEQVRRTRQSNYAANPSSASTIEAGPSIQKEQDLLVAGDDLEDECVAQAIQIFPSINHEFVREKYRQWRKGLAGDGVTNSQLSTDSIDPVIEVINRIAEMDSYPEESRKRKRAADDERSTQPTYEWGQDQAMMRSDQYIFDGLKLLAKEFTYVPTKTIYEQLRNTKKVFITYKYFEECERAFASLQKRPYHRLKNPRSKLEAKYEKTAKLPLSEIDRMHLVNELQAAKRECSEERRIAKRRKQDEEAEATNLKIHTEARMLVECQCCFDDETPINRAIPCDGDVAHFYCYACVKNQASSQIGQMRWEMRCVFSGNKPCTAPLIKSQLRDVLEAKTLAKLEELQFNDEVSLAAIEGLEDCPFCEFKAICDPVDINREFNCGNPDCLKTSCRLCHETTHLPKTCEEARKDRGSELRHTVEEAMTNALIRRCPNKVCMTAILKEYGCNKVICRKCSTIMCYACGADISKNPKVDAYSHFRGRGTERDTGCPLYDDNEHLAEVQNIARARDDTIKRLREENPGLEEASVQVENPKPRRPENDVPNPLPLRMNLGAYGEGLARHQQEFERAQNRRREWLEALPGARGMPVGAGLNDRLFDNFLARNLGWNDVPGGMGDLNDMIEGLAGAPGQHLPAVGYRRLPEGQIDDFFGVPQLHRLGRANIQPAHVAAHTPMRIPPQNPGLQNAQLPHPFPHHGPPQNARRETYLQGFEHQGRVQANQAAPAPAQAATRSPANAARNQMPRYVHQGVSNNRPHEAAHFDPFRGNQEVPLLDPLENYMRDGMAVNEQDPRDLRNLMGLDHHEHHEHHGTHDYRNLNM